MFDTALVDRLAAAYNAGDADGFAALFSRNAEFVNIFGMRMSGRSGIAAGHRAAFATRLAGTSMTVVDVSTSPVDTHTTVLHVEWFLTRTPAATVATLPECHGVLTLVATTHQGWSSIAAGTNVRSIPPTL